MNEIFDTGDDTARSSFQVSEFIWKPEWNPSSASCPALAEFVVPGRFAFVVGCGVHADLGEYPRFDEIDIGHPRVFRNEVRCEHVHLRITLNGTYGLTGDATLNDLLGYCTTISAEARKQYVDDAFSSPRPKENPFANT